METGEGSCQSDVPHTNGLMPTKTGREFSISGILVSQCAVFSRGVMIGALCTSFSSASSTRRMVCASSAPTSNVERAPIPTPDVPMGMGEQNAEGALIGVLSRRSLECRRMGVALSASVSLGSRSLAREASKHMDVLLLLRQGVCNTSELVRAREKECACSRGGWGEQERESVEREGVPAFTDSGHCVRNTSE